MFFFRASGEAILGTQRYLIRLHRLQGQAARSGCTVYKEVCKSDFSGETYSQTHFDDLCVCFVFGAHLSEHDKKSINIALARLRHLGEVNRLENIWQDHLY